MTEKVELTPELLRELQLKQLDMLVYFRDFCEKNNLTFYLIGGALIGALRNGGFVPWDDDVDVMLPRRTTKSCTSFGMNRAQTEDSDFSKPTAICSRAIFL